jgi:hypothetical protein
LSNTTGKFFDFVDWFHCSAPHGGWHITLKYGSAEGVRENNDVNVMMREFLAGK